VHTMICPSRAGDSPAAELDFAGEIQPHLGKLLGRGGFGAVYEATWRSHKVRMLQYFWLQSFY
jgi:hypothetical protein